MDRWLTVIFRFALFCVGLLTLLELALNFWPAVRPFRRWLLLLALQVAIAALFGFVREEIVQMRQSAADDFVRQNENRIPE